MCLAEQDQLTHEAEAKAEALRRRLQLHEGGPAGLATPAKSLMAA